MDSAALDREGRFLYRFAQGGMGVAGSGDVLRGGAKFDRERGFGDQGARVGANDGHAQYPVGRRMRQDLDESLAVAVGAGLRIGG